MEVIFSSISGAIVNFDAILNDLNNKAPSFFANKNYSEVLTRFMLILVPIVARPEGNLPNIKFVHVGKSRLAVNIYLDYPVVIESEKWRLCKYIISEISTKLPNYKRKDLDTGSLIADLQVFFNEYCEFLDSATGYTDNS